MESIYFKETDLTISERYEFDVSYQDWQDLLTEIELAT